MKSPPTITPKAGANLWVNPTTDPLRPKECLCRNCGAAQTCETRAEFKRLSKLSRVEWMVTTCPFWRGKGAAG